MMRCEIFTRVVLLAALGVVLLGCDNDKKGAHPCDDCLECEECTTEGTGEPHCAAQSHQYQQCVNASIYWFDSCDGQEDVALVCPEHSICENGGAQGAHCECVNNWEGEDCQVCPEHWDPDSDCLACEGNWDEDQNCLACEGNWDEDQNCLACEGNWDVAAGCEECLYQWLDVGNDCGTCPGNWDAAADCNACQTNWIGDDCEMCPGNWDATADCDACQTNWTGSDCETCPGNWDSTANCSVCENHWIDEGNDCGTCPGNWDSTAECDACQTNWTGADCETCPGNWDAAANCAVCENHWIDEGNDCGTCPGNWDAAADCNACQTNWTGSDCETCPGNWDSTANCAVCENHWIDEGNDCGTCPGNWDVSSDCSDCLGNWDPSADCVTCVGNWDLSTDCTVCANEWIDESNDCGTCPGNWDSSADCSACVGNWDPVIDCTVCANEWIDESNDCGTCPGNWDASAACDECVGNWDPVTDCTVCANEWIDESNDCGTCPGNWDPAADCSECADGWVDEGNNCGTCPDNWDESTDCACCLTGWDTDSDCTMCLPGWSGVACDEQIDCVRYVDIDADTTCPDGLSWGTAFTEIQDAVDSAALAVVGSGGPDVCEVWIAEGTYYLYKTSADDRIQLENDINLVGGFDGTETDRALRDGDLHVTTISGTDGPGGTARVTTAIRTSLENTLDSLHIESTGTPSVAGHAIDKPTGNLTIHLCHISDAQGNDDGTAIHFSGGGEVSVTDSEIYDCEESAIHTHYSSHVLDVSSCILFDNEVAIDLRYGTVTVSDSIFFSNGVWDGSGSTGHAISTGPGMIDISRCQFIQNRGDEGSAVYVDSDDVTIRDSYFTGNRSYHDGGAIFTSYFTSGLTLDNCVFADNVANYGYAIYFEGDTHVVTNCTFSGNSSTGTGYGAGLAIAGDITVRNSILYGNGDELDFMVSGTTLSMSYCLVEGGWTGAGNIDADPLFTDAAGGDFTLQPGSPCIDAANGFAAPEFDILGNSRVDDPSNANTGYGDPAYADMGAYEYQP